MKPLTNFTLYSDKEIQVALEKEGKLLGGIQASPAPHSPSNFISNYHMKLLAGKKFELLTSTYDVVDEKDVIKDNQLNLRLGLDSIYTLSIRRSLETNFTQIDITVGYDDRTPEGIREATASAYHDLFLLITDLKLNPVRIWNTMPRINENSDENGHGLNEIYKQFNSGRRREWLIYDPSMLSACAATVIGNQDPSSTLTIRCLASPFETVNIENPNQISFLNYSEKYGEAPMARRGTVHLVPDGIEVYVSGTASIVGEENRYCGDHEPKDVKMQVRQTLENIKTLISRENLLRQIPAEKLAGREIPEYKLSQLEAVRVYIRDGANTRIIREVVEKEYGLPVSNIMYIQGDICRRPLDVEIEAFIKS